jgi:hypothetical protein
MKFEFAIKGGSLLILADALRDGALESTGYAESHPPRFRGHRWWH